jgi:hypothetical protein
MARKKQTKPAAKPRVQDERVKVLVLLKNKRACCVCHAPEKAIQLHHIDGDHGNTVEKNLSVLCLTHHDQATAGLRGGQVGLGVKLTPDEVRAHKTAWETAVAAELKITKKTAPQAKRKQIELLFEFELTKAKNEILSSRNSKISASRFAFLTQYVIDEFISGIPYRKALLYVFEDIALRGCASEHIALPLVTAVLDLHPHLKGPNYVKMDAVDRSSLNKSIAVLDTVGIYGVEISKKPRTLARACEAIQELVEIASWYKFVTLRRGAIKTLRRFQRALKELSPEEKRGMDIATKQRTIARTLRLVSSK